jgi:hypothetical protein
MLLALLDRVNKKDIVEKQSQSKMGIVWGLFHINLKNNSILIIPRALSVSFNKICPKSGIRHKRTTARIHIFVSFLVRNLWAVT